MFLFLPIMINKSNYQDSRYQRVNRHYPVDYNQSIFINFYLFTINQSINQLSSHEELVVKMSEKPDTCAGALQSLSIVI